MWREYRCRIPSSPAAVRHPRFPCPPFPLRTAGWLRYVAAWGLGKAGEVTAAIAKGVESAKKNLVKVPILKGTVPHEQSARFGGAEVFIKPASHGTGVVAGGAMRAVLESVGITDVLAKSKGSSNPHNLVKATIEALSEMRDARMIAQNRGISVEKVFRG